MWTIQVPVISSAHITQETAELLTRNPDTLPVEVAPYRYGWFVFIFIPEIDVSLPADLAEVFGWFREQPQFEGANWLRIDADGDVVDGLPTYDW